MANLTISLNEKLIQQSRLYAEENHTSLNDFIRALLTKTVQKNNKTWLKECFMLMDKADGNSHGKTWSREDLHR